MYFEKGVIFGGVGVQWSLSSKESLGKEREKVVARLTRSQILYSFTGAPFEKSNYIKIIILRAPLTNNYIL